MSAIVRYRRELSVATAYALVLLVLAIVAPRFYLPANLRALVVSNAPVLVAAVGMTLVILCRQIDISVGSQFAICGMVAHVTWIPAVMINVASSPVEVPWSEWQQFLVGIGFFIVLGLGAVASLFALFAFGVPPPMIASATVRD